MTPLAAWPMRMMVSMAWDLRMVSNTLPENALVRCLAITGSPSPGLTIDPSSHVTAAPPRVGSLHRTPPVLRIIPEHQRGLYIGEASEACHGFTPPAVLDTPCRTGSAHHKCRHHQDL